MVAFSPPVTLNEPSPPPLPSLLPRLPSRISYPLPSDNAAIAPDLLGRAAEAGMDPTKFGDDVMSFMTGGVSAEEMVARRKAKIDSEGIKGVMKE